MPIVIENGTGKDMQLDVYYSVKRKPDFGPLALGTGAHLPGDVKDLKVIEYTYDGRKCIMDHDKIQKETMPGKFREKYRIVLHGC